jgi:hypothetical protein
MLLMTREGMPSAAVVLGDAVRPKVAAAILGLGYVLMVTDVRTPNVEPPPCF